MKKFENKNTGVVVTEDHLNSIILGDIIEMVAEDEEALEKVKEIVNNVHGGAKEMRQALVAAFWDNDFIEVEE